VGVQASHYHWAMLSARTRAKALRYLRTDGHVIFSAGPSDWFDMSQGIVVDVSPSLTSARRGPWSGR
jgi:hypothetical protein